MKVKLDCGHEIIVSKWLEIGDVVRCPQCEPAAIAAEPAALGAIEQVRRQGAIEQIRNGLKLLRVNDIELAEAIDSALMRSNDIELADAMDDVLEDHVLEERSAVELPVARTDLEAALEQHRRFVAEIREALAEKDFIKEEDLVYRIATYGRAKTEYERILSKLEAIIKPTDPAAADWVHLPDFVRARA